MSVSIGVDTGGTYTDAVLFHQSRGVLSSAKALTTHHELSLGIGEAITTVLRAHDADRDGPVSFLSVSTTLATNALAEKTGAPICIMLIGYPDHAIDPQVAEHGFAQDAVVRVRGGHTVQGDEQDPLDLEAIRRVANEQRGRVKAFAVSGYFSVRNNAHELVAREQLEELTGLPVSCGHELSSKLHAGRRALTTAWNARLIPLLTELVAAVRVVMADNALRCPLMMVKGDGSLVTAETAQAHAVQTILSGPAASVVGAQYLHGLDQACVVDIGGTTTDIAFIRGGRPVVSPEGARVGELRTMVSAVQMYTVALGGDSAVKVNDAGELTFGPGRVVPVSLALLQHPEAWSIFAAGARRPHQTAPSAAEPSPLETGEFRIGAPVQNAMYLADTPVIYGFAHAANAAREAGAFLVRTETAVAAELVSPSQQAILNAATDGVVSYEQLLLDSSSVYRTRRDVDALLRRGWLRRAGFTPSDAAHLLGRQSSWDGRAAAAVAATVGQAAAARGATPFSQGDGRDEAEHVAQWVFQGFVAASARAIVHAAVSEMTGSDADTEGPIARALVDDAVHPARRGAGTALLLGAALTLHCPIVAVGAPAQCYYREVAGVLNTQAVIPRHAEVANALGAVVGQVRSAVTVRITPINGNELFRVHVPGNIGGGTEDFTSVEKAEAAALRHADAAVRSQARTDGAHDYEVNVQVERIVGRVLEGEMLIEIAVHAEAIGRPQA